MEFFKRLKRFLFGSSRSSKSRGKKKAVKKKAARKTSAARKPAAGRKPVKKEAAKKAAARSSSERKRPGTAAALKKTAAVKRPVKKVKAAPKARTAVKKRGLKKAAGVKPKALRGKPKPAPDSRTYLGEITHFFPKAKAAVLQLENKLALGDVIVIEGGEIRFRQKVKSMQINRIPIHEGRPDEEVGLEVMKTVGIGYKVYKL